MKLTLTFNDEQWEMIYKEIPRGLPLRSELKDVADDAKTWGESEYEFDEQDLATLLKFADFAWVEEKVDAAKPSESQAPEPQSTVTTSPEEG